MGNLKFPLVLQDVPEVEVLNNLQINIFNIAAERRVLFYISKKEDCINLLLIENEEGNTCYE